MKDKHLFPWWAGYLLINPLRKLSLDPEKILVNYITEGMTVIDAGCAMGYFSLPAARMVGEGGKVVCVDLQERMLKTLRKRADKSGLSGRIETRLCAPDRLMIDEYSGKTDVALAFGVVHEVPDETAFISDIAHSLKPGGKFILGEPKGPVSATHFLETVKLVAGCGLKHESSDEFRSCRTAVFRKP
ncbi:MAG TPA: methyltransferase domain-containing protein [Spirochaetota bacterium]|nr:methyltransferase domain-containing protein [Spirochaetota bacterium]HPJ34302.1 methyltransferase domain-containing protein [Spirochaetota bacterium]